MRLTSRRCVVWGLVLLLVASMFWLHITVVYEESPDAPATSPGRGGPVSVYDKTSESLSDIMAAIQSRMEPVAAAPPPADPSAKGGEGSVVLAEITSTVEKGVAVPREDQGLEDGRGHRGAPELATRVPPPLPGQQAPSRELAKLKPLELSEDYRATFQKHMSWRLPAGVPLDGYMRRLSVSPQCRGKPIFVTMARVKSDLYWQLIENFFFTMYRFGHTDCAVMICISDQVCVDRCQEHGFPCYDYRHDNGTDPVFLQIGKLKLYYVGEAIKRGVDVMLLDLDVSFLRDPLELMVGFLDNETEHVRCQMDLIYSMNKDENGDLYWFSHPGPNFGLFVVKSSDMTKKVFREAWRKYQKIPFIKKNRVASDQNVINGALSAHQWRMDKIFVAYFFIGTDSDQNKRANVHRELLTPLLDKIEYYSPDHIRFELGATAARQELKDAIAVHATCYEGSTKLLALKAVNAFWDIRYYTPTERTITKPLMLVTSVADLRMELRALAYLALQTNRSLIVPNILIGTGSGIRGKDRSRSACKSTQKVTCDATLPEAADAWAGENHGRRRLEAINLGNSSAGTDFGDVWRPGRNPSTWQPVGFPLNESSSPEQRTRRRLEADDTKKKNKKRGPPKKGGVWDPLVTYHDQTHTAFNRGERYWPAFRTIHSTRSDLKVLEPGYYYRLEDDFKKTSPEPVMITIDVANGKTDLNDALSAVKAHDGDTRLVLDFTDSRDSDSTAGRGRPVDMVAWAKDPLSAWGDAVIDKRGYVFVPQFQNKNKNLYRKDDILDTVYICPEFLRREYGNRACFNKCT